MSNIEDFVPGGGNRSIRLGVDLSTGHGCFPPTVPSSASPNVFHNLIPGVRLTDTYVPHCCNSSCHTPVVAISSKTVFINQLSQHAAGDIQSCSDVASNGSPDVFNR
jgi:uncharacterized Zn-binding protein involved in type VI secretion